MNTHINKMIKRFLFIVICCLGWHYAQAQSASINPKITIDMQDVTLKDVLKEIEGQSHYFFLYDKRNVDEGRIVSISVKEEQVANVLAQLFKGTQVSYSIDKQSGSSCEMLIPLSAVRQDSGGTYCLIAEARDTVLGTEYHAARVNITVEDKDSTQAAVTGNLGRDDLVISGSTKDIEEGDKVRLKE